MSEMQQRQLELTSLDEIMAEVERLASGPSRTTGNYSFAQIVEHLATTLDIACGHKPAPKLPLPMRWAATLMRSLVLGRPMKPGFKLPAKSQSVLWTESEIPVEDAVAHMREAMQRFRDTEPLPAHPVFGKMNREQSNLLQCRHCTLHLSLVHPENESTNR